MKHVAHEVLAGTCWTADKAKEVVSHLNQNRPLPFFLNVIPPPKKEKKDPKTVRERKGRLSHLQSAATGD